MSIRVTETIPSHQMEKFHEILCATGGRYLNNPQKFGNKSFIVTYESGDYNLQHKMWFNYTTDIKEIKKDQIWRKLLRRIIFVFKFTR